MFLPQPAMNIFKTTKVVVPQRNTKGKYAKVPLAELDNFERLETNDECSGDEEGEGYRSTESCSEGEEEDDVFDRRKALQGRKGNVMCVRQLILWFVSLV